MNSSIQEQSTVTKIVMAVLIAGVLAWAASITATVSAVTRLEPQIDQLQRNDDFQSEWIATWPTEGELAADVRQTRDIEFLFEDLAAALDAIDANTTRIDNSIQALEDRVRTIEIESAR